MVTFSKSFYILMNFYQLVEEVAIENDLKPFKVKQILLAALAKIEKKLEADETIRTPNLVFKPKKNENKLILALIRKIDPDKKSTINEEDESSKDDE